MSRSNDSPFRRAFQLATALVLFAAALGASTTTASSSPITAFEITDANVIDAPEGVPYDWSSLFTSTGAPTAIDGILARSFTGDPISSDALPSPPCAPDKKGDLTAFTSNGSDKNGDDIPTWTYESGSVPASKDDLTNVYAAAVKDDASTVFYFALERSNVSGTSHADFEFLQSEVALEPGTNRDGTPKLDSSGCPSGTFIGSRSVGDILVSMNWVHGGTVGIEDVRVWNGVAYVAPSVPLAGLVGIVQNDEEIACGDWTCRDEKGDVASTLAAHSFAEGYVNVSGLFASAVPCYSSVIAKTRSSEPFTAELKDFALGAFDTCDARISLTPDGLNEVGKNHTFTAKVDSNEAGAFAPLEGAIVDGSATFGSFVGSSSCVTDGSGTCTLTLASPTAGTSTVNASTTVVVGGRTTVRSTVANSGSGGSGPATKRWVDASVAVHETATNEVNDAHRFTVTATPLAQPGTSVANVSITPSATPTPDVVINTCGQDVAVVDGVASCTYTINSATIGVFEVDASAVVSYQWGDLTEDVTRSTSANAGPAGNAGGTKTYVDALITVSPSATNNVNDAHVFNVAASALPAGAAALVFDSITTSVVPEPSSVVSTCNVPALNGDTATCTVTINSTTPGVFIANATATMTIGGASVTRSTDQAIASSGPGGSGPATKTYIDTVVLSESLVRTPEVLGRAVAPAAGEPAVLGVVMAAPLPATGLELTPLVGTGLILVLVGAGLLFVRSRLLHA